MVKRTGPTNYQLRMLIEEIKDKAVESRFWKRINQDLSKPSRQRRTVNLYKINRYAKDGETVIIPGKVLSLGELDKKVNVVALSFSAEARQKIIDAKGETLSINELLQKNPKGDKVRILG
jgi:large subunit ribosomal protein L18e